MHCQNLKREQQLLEGMQAALKKSGRKKIRIMEVCGTHTMSIARSGLKQILPKEIELISGTGCPVCVTPAGMLDEILKLSENPNVIITSYGDMLRVPGSRQGDSLSKRKALGANLEIVYSPMDALDLAEKNPNKEIVFLGVGFETTAPGTAASVLAARERDCKNFSVLGMLKRVEPALRSLIESEDFAVDAFLCPGHVATILGEDGFRFLTEEYRIPAAIAGFEPLDILECTAYLVRQVEWERPVLWNEYTKAVRREGNPVAREILDTVWEPCTDVWRGLGEIPESGYRMKEEFADWDAVRKFTISAQNKEAVTACRCGDIIRGQKSPKECPLFGKTCVPENPVGPCMVSSEGACAAAYKYQID